MRVSVTEADQLVIRKAAKLIIKFTHCKIKHTAMLGVISTWLGYIDYKQVRRLVVNGPEPIDLSELDALHDQVEKWLREQGKETDLKSAIDSLRFNRLSAFSYRPNTLPMIIEPQKKSNLHPKMVVFDEMNQYFSIPFEKKGESRTETAIVDAMKHLNLPCFEWWVPEKVLDINAPSVIILSKLTQLAAPVLKELQQSDSYHFWNEEQKLKGITAIKALYPQAMISAVEALSSEDLKVQSFGFRLKKGTDEAGNSVYSLYNSNIYAFMPYVWVSRVAAQEALAMLLSTGSTPAFELNSVTGEINFDEIGRVSVNNGYMKQNVPNLPNANIQLHVIKRFDNDDLKPLDALLKTCGQDRSRFEYLSMSTIQKSKTSGWVNCETLSLITDCVKSFETNICAAKTLLNNADLNSECLIEALKRVVPQNEPGEYLDIDNPESLKKSFPMLFKGFAINVIDDWHYDCATFSGALRKTCGFINANQSEMLGFMAYKAVTGESCTTEADRDTGIILAAVAVERDSWDFHFLSALAETIEEKFKKLDGVISELSDLSSGLWSIKAPSLAISCGSTRFTYRDTRSIGSIPIKVTQKVSDFAKLEIP